MFHYEQWTDSCALRFGIQALGIAFLVAMYSMVIIEAIESQSLSDIGKDPEAIVYLRIS